MQHKFLCNSSRNQHPAEESWQQIHPSHSPPGATVGIDAATTATEFLHMNSGRNMNGRECSPSLADSNERKDTGLNDAVPEAGAPIGF
jgi:hypothetical protein